LGAERFIDGRTSQLLTAGVGLGRAAMGAAVLVRPGGLPKFLGVSQSASEQVGWLVRMFGARDAALGLGAAWAALRGGPTRPWLLAQAAGDGTDALVFALGARSGSMPAPRAYGLAAFALSGVLGELALTATAQDSRS
jgi:hypothetical protein